MCDIQHQLTPLALAIRTALSSLIFAATVSPAFSDTTIPSQTSTYNLSAGAGPFVMPSPNIINATSNGSNGITGGNTDDWQLTIEEGASVQGRAYGIYLDSATGGALLNNAGVITSGTGDGVRILSGGTVTNSGSIIGFGSNNTGNAVYFNSDSGTYVGTAGSSLTGGYGVTFNTGTGSFTNAGNIDVEHTGIRFLEGSSGTIDNQAGGLIKGKGDAVNLSTSGLVTVNNAGDIQSGDSTFTAVSFGTGGGSYTGTVGSSLSGGYGVDFNGSTNTLINAGNIDVVHTAVRFFEGSSGTVDNQAGGLINAPGNAITITTSGSVIISNAGSITAGGNNYAGISFGDGSGTYEGKQGSVVKGGYAITVNNGPGIITNSGTITGTAHNAIYYQGASSGTLDNLAGGVITAKATGVNITGSGTVAMTNAGSITGTNAIAFGSDNNTLLNRGGLTGTGANAILLTGDNNAVTLAEGSTLTGAVNSSGSGNTLTVIEQGAVNSNLTGLASIIGAADTGQSWTLGGSTMNTNGTDAHALWVQSGTLILQGALTHNGTGGSTTIDPNAVLQLGNNTTTGSVSGNILDNGTLHFNRSNALNFAGLISGSGTVVQNGSNTLTLSGANTYTGGTTVAAGTLNASAAPALGSGAVTVDNGGTLNLSFANGTFSNAVDNSGVMNVTGAGNTLGSTVTGAGVNRLSALDTAVTGDNSGFTGSWDITSAGGASVTAAQNLGAAGVTLNGLLDIAPASGNFTFGNALSGTGLMNVALASGSTFALAGTTGSLFAGTLQLGQSLFSLSGNNTAALTNATLQMDTGNTTTVGAGTQTIGGLNLNGGTLAFTNLPGSSISTGDLALTGGTVQIDPSTVAASGGNLMAQDDGVARQLIAATGVTGSAANLTLTDLTGAALTDTQVDITQNSNTVAVGTYGYALNNTGGLNVGFTLNQLDLQAGQTLTLSGDTTTPSGASDMKARLTGSGNLAIDATNAITLTRGDNDFTGTTTVTGGTLRAGAVDIIADSSQLTLNSGTTFDLGGFNQRVNKLTGTGNVSLGAGTLAVNTASGTTTYDGVVSGSGAVTKTGGGTWQLSNNQAWTGGTTIGAGTLQVGTGGTSGALAGNVANSGTLMFNRSDDITFGGIISGSGALVQSSSADGVTTLTGNNTYTGATTVAAGTLQLGNGGTSGALATGSPVSVNSGATLAFNRSNALAVGNTVGGAGSVLQSGSGVTTLSGNNTYAGGTTVAAGALTASGASALGSGAVTVDSGGTLGLSFVNGTFSNAVDNSGVMNVTGAGNTLGSTVTGAGVNRLSALDTAVTGDNSGFTGSWDITSAGGASVTAAQNLGTAGVTLNGLLDIAPASGNFTFGNALSGAGLMNVALASGSTFALAGTTGSLFAGTLQLGQSQFSLSGNNTAALTNATLQMDTGNTTTVGAGTQTIGGLNLNGGTLIFTGQIPPNAPDGIVSVADLALNSGEVRVDLPAGGVPNPAPGGKNLFAQDNQNTLTQLVSASGAVSGSAGNLTLADENGAAVSSPQQFGITEGASTVANATYDYGLTTGSGNDGLYVNYGLTELDLLASQTLHLAADAGAAGGDASLTAKITGVGNLDVNASQATGQLVSLNNSGNDYTGTTTVSGGTLLLGSNHALGATSLLTVNSGATANINGKTQTIGALGGAGSLAVNGGDLTVNNGGNFSGAINGNTGTLRLSGGTLTLTGSNQYAGATTVDSDATLQIGDGGTTGNYVSHVTNNGVLSFNRSDDVMLSGGVTGSGALNQDGAGTLFVTSAVQTTGPVNINAGTLSIGNGVTDGSITSNIVNNGELVLNRSVWSYGGVISGSGTLDKRNTSHVTLTGENTYSGGTTVTAGILNAANASALGTGEATIASGGTLLLSFIGNEFDNNVLNDGVMNVTGAGVTVNSDITGTGVNRISALGTQITGDNSGFTGSWDITGGGASATVRSGENLGDAAVQLNGLLNIAPTSGDYAFGNALTGSGFMAVNMSSVSNAFSFTPTTGTDFGGTLIMRKGTLALDATNSDVLNTATLMLGVGGIATLEADRSIGNLSFNGGMLDVEMTSPSSAHILTVNSVNVDPNVAPSNIGVVNLRTSALPPSSAPQGNLLDQDSIDTGGGIQVVKATTVTSAGKQLTLLLDGAAPADDTEIISDGFGHDDVVATYGYSSVISAGEAAPGGAGVYTGYMLKVLNSQSSVVLDNTGAQDNTMGAQLNGSGDFEFRAGNGAITLVNSTNDYQGQTLLSSGTLKLGDNHTLGQTRALNIASGAMLDVNGYAQSIGQLNGASGSGVALNGGALTITNGGQSDGSLSGEGQLNLTGGDLTLTQASPDLNAAVDVASGATARLKHAVALGSSAVSLAGNLVLDAVTGTLANPIQGTGNISLENGSDSTLSGNNSGYSGAVNIGTGNRLTVQQAANTGTATITNNGELVLDSAGQWAFANAMSGTGRLTKQGVGTVTLSDDYGHSGGTHVAAGTLALAETSAALSGGGPVTVDSGATLGGYGTIIGNVTSNGALAAGDAITTLSGGAGNLTVQGNLDNLDTVNLAGKTVGNTLTVTGDYAAHSTLRLNTILGGDNSKTDKLIVQGNTSGHTDVYVTNKGGAGQQTVNGIQVIEVGGVSAGTFSLANRVVAGAYDYKLLQGTPDVNDGDWYLRVPVATPDKPVVPVRPEAGAYLGNQGASINMFMHSLHDRVGESRSVEGNGAVDQASSSWIRLFGSRANSRSAGQIDQDTWSNGVQLGFDVANNLEIENQWHVGVMGGYGSARTRNVTEGESFVARSTVDGYSVGIYGTWFADGRPEGTGPYIDTWAQYGWYNNKVNGEGLPEQKYDSRTQAVSVEGGWAFNVYTGSVMSVYIQPQEQLVYTHLNVDDVTEDNGTKVENRNDGGFANRLGLRVYGYSANDKWHQWKPFIETNWLYNSYRDSVSMDGETLNSDTPKHRVEVKAGLETKLTNRWHVWGNIGTQQGQDNYSQVEGGLGVKYTW